MSLRSCQAVRINMSCLSLLFFLLLIACAPAANPEYVTEDSLFAPYYGVDVEGDVIYAVSYGVTNGNGFVHAYMLNGNILETLDYEAVDGARKVKAVGNRVYVLYSYYLGGLWRSGLNIYLFEGPGTEFVAYDTGLYWIGKSLGFDVAGERAYVPIENDRMMIINVTDPPSLRVWSPTG